MGAKFTDYNYVLRQINRLRCSNNMKNIKINEMLTYVTNIYLLYIK